MDKVLILDGRSLSCLAFVRSLGSGDIEIHVGESFKRSISTYSRYVDKSYVYPSAEERPKEFKKRLITLLDEKEYDFVVPTRDKTTQLLTEVQDCLPYTTETLLSTLDNFDRLNDKARCNKLAEQVGVPTPSTYYPSETEIDKIAEQASFPVLVKPTIAAGARGIVRADAPHELEEAYAAVSREHGPTIVQEFIDHSGGHFSVGTVFDRESEPRAVHVYKELTQYPDSGGPAIEAISVNIEPWVNELLEILRQIDWVGPAHMDVLLDPKDGTYKLLEVNPRIWMSIGLTINSGVNVPQIAWAIANEEDPKPVTTYQTGLRYRWVLPNQLLWVIAGDQPLNRVRWLFKRRADPTCYGVLSMTDPQAILGVAAQSLSFIIDAEKRKTVLGRGWKDD